MEPQNQYRFLNGLDDIGITLSHADAISKFETHRPQWLSHR
jgi:3-isopropylmalate/(R)-2-methylmalate dehydratase small subunit